MPALDQKALAEIKHLEAMGQFDKPAATVQNFYCESIVRVPLDQWPDPGKPAFAKLNKKIYVPLEGPSEMGASGKLADWDRSADLPISVPTLSIGARYDTMEPAQMEKIAKDVRHGRYLFCPNGSHMAIYDDQKVYMAGLIQFIQDVDSSRF